MKDYEANNICPGMKNCPDYMRLSRCAMAYEKELRKHLSEKDFVLLTASIAKELIVEDIKNMPEGEFKDFLKDHFKESTGEEIE